MMPCYRICWRPMDLIALDDVWNAKRAETYAQNLEDAVSHGVFGAHFYVLEYGAKFWC